MFWVTTQMFWIKNMLLLCYVLSYDSPINIWVLFEESYKSLDNIIVPCNKENT